jgi:hypothetical protein
LLNLPQKLPRIPGRLTGPVIGGRSADIGLEKAVKCFQTGKTGEIGDIGNRSIGIQKVFLGLVDADSGKIGMKGLACPLLKKAGKVKFA